MTAQNPQFPPIPSGVFDRWLSDTLGAGTPNWDRLWFNPARVPQSAELNELQSMFWTYMIRVCNTFLVEGQVISGLTPTLSGTTVSITAGMMYIQGRIRPIAAGTATITGSGSETVGLLYTNTTLVPQSDPELLNPVTTVITGPQQYSLLGASRMSMTFAWTADSSASNYTPVFQYVNGVLQVASYVAHSPYVSVPYTATPTFNCALGTPDLVVFQMPGISGNVTSSTITNLQPGQVIKFILSTTSTPNSTFVWPTGNLFGGGTVPLGSGSLTMAASTNYIQSFLTSGTPYAIAESSIVSFP